MESSEFFVGDEGASLLAVCEEAALLLLLCLCVCNNKLSAAACGIGMLLQSKSPLDRSMELLKDRRRKSSPLLSKETSTNKLFVRAFRNGGEPFDSRTSSANNCLSVRNFNDRLLNSGDLSTNIGPPAGLGVPCVAKSSRSRNSER